MDEGTRQDFTEFVAARSRQLTRLAYVLTGDQHAAEDLLQNALVKAAANWGRIHTAPEAYVRRIMYREQVSWLRRRGAASVCIRFTGTGMTITRLESAHVQRGPQGHQYQIDIRLTPADARRFATLTRELAGQHSPRNQLAIVTNGYVLADPVVIAAITAGQAAIPGFATRPQAEFFLATLTGG